MQVTLFGPPPLGLVEEPSILEKNAFGSSLPAIPVSASFKEKFTSTPCRGRPGVEADEHASPDGSAVVDAVRLAAVVTVAVMRCSVPDGLASSFGSTSRHVLPVTNWV